VEEYANSNQCVKIHLLLEDLRSKKAGEQKKWNEQYVLSCSSTISESIGYELRYYQRYYDQNKDDQFAVKADAPFKSVTIED